MNILAVDTTGGPLSVALRAGDKIYSFHKTLTKPHDETLLDVVDKLLKKAKLELSDLDGIAAASGPGRFTGIRVGMAYAAVAARCIGKPALAVSRLEALAHGKTGRFVIRGLRDDTYWQEFPKGRPVWGPAPQPAVEGDPTAEALLGPAADCLASGKRPPFEPLYLKPAGYERPKSAGR